MGTGLGLQPEQGRQLAESRDVARVDFALPQRFCQSFQLLRQGIQMPSPP